MTSHRTTASISAGEASRATRDIIEAEIERLISLLDLVDGDSDREPNLGWTTAGILGSGDDRELDPVDEGEPDVGV